MSFPTEVSRFNIEPQNTSLTYGIQPVKASEFYENRKVRPNVKSRGSNHFKGGQIKEMTKRDDNNANECRVEDF